MSAAPYSSPPASNKPSSPGAKVPYPMSNGHGHGHAHHPSMDSRQGDYNQSEQPPAGHYPPQQDPRYGNFASSTPASEHALPSSARSGNFPEFVNQRPNYSPGQGPPTGGMPQQQNPSIAASPTYPPQGHYPQYQTQPDLYGAGNPGVYARPEWPTGHYPQQMGHYPHAVSSGPPSAGLVSPGGISTVYSFVPIPGAQQHKRPRRRYEEIERMYKCGWNGCEKAYGTLNHLNAHVTMQSHGTKRTPEEFKEIRKEWKQKKKEEEANRKAEEERQRAQDDPVRGSGQPNQLPPLYSGPPATPGYGAPSPAMEGMPNYPTSPYGPSHNIYTR